MSEPLRAIAQPYPVRFRTGRTPAPRAGRHATVSPITHTAAMPSAAVSSMSVERPTALSAWTVDGHACRGLVIYSLWSMPCMVYQSSTCPS